jgi:hypothetical protein
MTVAPVVIPRTSTANSVASIDALTLVFCGPVLLSVVNCCHCYSLLFLLLSRFGTERSLRRRRMVARKMGLSVISNMKIPSLHRNHYPYQLLPRAHVLRCIAVAPRYYWQQEKLSRGHGGKRSGVGVSRSFRLPRMRVYRLPWPLLSARWVTSGERVILCCCASSPNPRDRFSCAAAKSSSNSFCLTVASILNHGC